MAEQQKLSCLKFLYADITSNTYFTWFTWNVLGETDVSDNGQIIMSGFFFLFPLLVDFLQALLKAWLVVLQLKFLLCFHHPTADR